MRSTTACELRAIANLLELGHKVAVPVVDDDGVDLVIDYHLRANVKSCARLLGDRWEFEFKATRKKVRVPIRVDFFFLYALDVDAWWIIPASEIQTKDGTIRRISIAPDGPRDQTWRDAWHAIA
jgi:hypothetical protein